MKASEMAALAGQAARFQEEWQQSLPALSDDTIARVEKLVRDAQDSIEAAAKKGLFHVSHPVQCGSDCCEVMREACKRLDFDGFRVNDSDMEFAGRRHCSLEIHWGG